MMRLLGLLLGSTLALVLLAPTAWAAVAIADAKTGNATAANSTTSGSLSGLTAGDLILCNAGWKGTVTAATGGAPTGFTVIGEGNSSGGLIESESLSYKVASGSETTLTSTFSGGTAVASAIACYRVTGAAAAPIGASTTRFSTGSSALVRWNVITTTVNGSMVVGGATALSTASEGAPNWNLTASSGYTAQTGVTDNTHFLYSGIETKILSTAGAETPGNITQAFGDSMASVTVEVYPASAHNLLLLHVGQ